MQLPIAPIPGRIIVREITKDDMSPGGIALPDSAREKGTQTGVVVSVGLGPRTHTGAIGQQIFKVDDIVYFTDYASSLKLEHDGEELAVISEQDILAYASPAPDAEPVLSAAAHA